MDSKVLQSMLISQPPQVDPVDAARICYQLFDVQVDSLRLLSSERDQNYLIHSTEENQQYVLKFINSAEESQVTKVQGDVLEHISKIDSELPVPRVKKSISGRTEEQVCIGTSIEPLAVRLLSFLDGEPVQKIEIKSGVLKDLGTQLARLDIALKKYKPSWPYRNSILWDIQRCHELIRLINDKHSIKNQEILNATLTNYIDKISPNISSIRHQYIHNDINLNNVLVDRYKHEYITGIIDFGDMIYAPLINELATALAYHISLDGDPFHNTRDIIYQYHKAIPLERLELKFLPDLIMARLAITVLITEYRAQIFPANKAYILRNNEKAKNALCVLFKEKCSTGFEDYFLRLIDDSCLA